MELKLIEINSENFQSIFNDLKIKLDYFLKYKFTDLETFEDFNPDLGFYENHLKVFPEILPYIEKLKMQKPPKDKNVFRQLLEKFNWDNYEDPFEILFSDIINRYFEGLYKFSISNNIYYSFCSYDVFIKNYQLNYQYESDKLTDLKEYNYAFKLYEEISNSQYISSYLNEYCQSNFLLSSKLKIDFLKKIILENGFQIKVLEGSIVFTEVLERINSFVPEIHIESVAQLSAKAKSIILNETGILSVLKEKYCLDGNLSPLIKICSALTDIPVSTIQPYLNTILKDTKNDRNYPYTNKSINDANVMLEKVGSKIKFKPK